MERIEGLTSVKLKLFTKCVRWLGTPHSPPTRGRSAIIVDVKIMISFAVNVVEKSELITIPNNRAQAQRVDK